MTTLVTLTVIFWGGLTAVLVGLLIYRGTLRLHESGHIFLDDAEAHLAKEQEQLLQRIKKLQPWVRTFGAASGTVIVILAALEVVSLTLPQ
jgi:hypothetical protein